ncbi:MAG TPA: RMD1 family protein [Selenomonadales bacterium]|nr:RMD1 family protein [Selenomonadales bacterium]
MESSKFKAAALTNELNLNKIAGHFGIDRKFKWEDSLVLGETALKGVLNDPAGKAIHIFPFGSLVFINCEYHEIMDAVRYLAQVEKNLAAVNGLEYADDYEIQVAGDEQPAINYDYLVIPDEPGYHFEIVATVLAKSVALERIESDTDVLVDEFEEIIALLRQGRLTISDEQLAKISARILGFRLSTISYLMLLDKPEITWVNEEAEALFTELSALFELNDRFDNVKHKTDVLLDITEVFAGLAHSKQGTRLEWAIIVLIAIEIVLSLIDMFMGK